MDPMAASQTIGPALAAGDGFVVGGELRFHLRRWGHARAPAALLLHGLTGNAWEWDPVAASLSRHFHVIAIDQRGHGATDWTDDYAPERMLDDLEEIIAALGLGPAAIVGHSMGALNAFMFAAGHPKLVERVVIVDFGPDSVTPEDCEAWESWLRIASRTSYSDRQEAIAEWSAMNPRARESHLRHFIVHNLLRRDDGRWRWRFDTAGLAGFLRRVPDETAQWNALRRIDHPALVIRGAQSEILRSRTACRMVQEMPAARLVELPGGGHDLTVEQPVALEAAIRSFLQAP